MSPSTALPPADYTVLYRFAVALAGANAEAEHMVHEALEAKLGHISAQETSQNRLVLLLQAVWNEKTLPKNDSPVSNLPPVFHRMSPEKRAAHALRSFGLENHAGQICGTTPEWDETSVPAEKITAALESIPVSPELLKRFAVTAQSVHAPFRIFSVVGLTVLFAALALLGMAGWMWHDWSSKMDEEFARKFVDSAEKLTENSLEPVDMPVGELTDHLFLKYGLENYSLPADFAKMQAALVGVDHIDGHPVVQIGLKESRAMLMIFRTEDFGLEREETSWRTVEIADWALALRTQNGQGTVLTVQGKKDDLQAILPK